MTTGPESRSASEAARAMNRLRWGSTRVDRLAAEVASRSGEISPTYRAALRAALTDPDDEENQR